MDVPELVANGRRYVTDEAKAEVLIDTFFPIPPILETSEDDITDTSR